MLTQSYEGRLLIPLDEAARKLGISPHTLRKWQATGQIESTRLGNRIMFRPDVLDEAARKGVN